MEILGLTPGKFIIAIVVAACLTIAITALTAPHPVEVPKIAITPVPTPSPVVITEKPTQAPVEPRETLSQVMKETMKNVQSNIELAFNVLQALMVFMLIFFPVSLLFRRM